MGKEILLKEIENANPLNDFTRYGMNLKLILKINQVYWNLESLWISLSSIKKNSIN